MTASTPSFLFVELPSEHANQRTVLAELAGLVTQRGGSVYAHAPAGLTAGLEPGTVAAGLLVARFADAAALQAAGGSLVRWLKERLPEGATPLVLQVNGLPLVGLPEMPEIPTIASVAKPPPSPRNTFLVIRGSAWDQARLDAYRDIILPMHHERGGYYEVFALQPGEVVPLAGEWREQIFAISRWPSRERAEDFWFADRYQREAIPLRLGAGRFTVNLVESTE